jgi:C2H2 type zinc finger protein
MSEREAQSGDAETATCHVCDQRFETQADLLKHLQTEHPDEVLPDMTAE